MFIYGPCQCTFVGSNSTMALQEGVSCLELKTGPFKWNHSYNRCRQYPPHFQLQVPRFVFFSFLIFSFLNFLILKFFPMRSFLLESVILTETAISILMIVSFDAGMRRVEGKAYADLSIVLKLYDFEWLLWRGLKINIIEYIYFVIKYYYNILFKLYNYITMMYYIKRPSHLALSR